LGSAEVAGKTLIQTTSNGTAGISGAHGADRIYARPLATAEATARALKATSRTAATEPEAGCRRGVRPKGSRDRCKTSIVTRVAERTG
jgi:phosphosulfolactate phosphohydrolase-like enzyme